MHFSTPIATGCPRINQSVHLPCNATLPNLKQTLRSLLPRGFWVTHRPSCAPHVRTCGKKGPGRPKKGRSGRADPAGVSAAGAAAWGQLTVSAVENDVFCKAHFSAYTPRGRRQAGASLMSRASPSKAADALKVAKPLRQSSCHSRDLPGPLLSCMDSFFFVFTPLPFFRSSTMATSCPSVTCVCPHSSTCPLRSPLPLPPIPLGMLWHHLRC